MEQDRDCTNVSTLLYLLTICLVYLCTGEQLQRTHERQKQHCDEREKDSRDDN